MEGSFDGLSNHEEKTQKLMERRKEGNGRRGEKTKRKRKK